MRKRKVNKRRRRFVVEYPKALPYECVRAIATGWASALRPFTKVEAMKVSRGVKTIIYELVPVDQEDMR